MKRSFLDAYANWYGKLNDRGEPAFKGIMSANPLMVTDPSCIASEPMEGWDAWKDTGKTQTWRSTFFNAAVVAYDGRDTPNNDFPQDKGPRYHYLIGKKKFDGTVSTFGENSWQYWSQCVGKPNLVMNAWMVLNRQLCKEHHALDHAEWLDGKHTWIYGVDPNYGGDDRCIGIPIEFGMGLDGKEIIKVYPTENMVVSVMAGMSPPEDQIAAYVKRRLTELGIPPKNCFYDSTGKGTLGNAFARLFGFDCPIPVDSGAVPTQRPVRFDLFVDDNNGRRLKTCREHYSKFVSEMWYSVREAVESDQIRELPKDVMDELCSRMYRIVNGNKTEVEPKDELKERIRCSPDLADAFCISVEGARQRGFRISRLGVDALAADEEDYLAEEQERYETAIKESLLTHV
jgi:hypothetical protein